MRIIVDKMPEKPSKCLFSKLNVEYGYLCSLNEENVGNRVCRATNCPYLTEDCSVKSDEILDIKGVLKELSLTPESKGYSYIEFLLESFRSGELSYTDKSMYLYEVVGRKFKSTSSRVERCIRHSVEKVFENSPTEVLAKYFGNTISSASGKVTNSQFLAILGEYIK